MGFLSISVVCRNKCAEGSPRYDTCQTSIRPSVEILCIFPMYIQHTTVYSFTWFVFWLRLSTAYITTAKIYIMVFYCLFQDHISKFNRCFAIRWLGFYGSLCISYAPFLVMIFLIITLHGFVFTHIICHLPGWISGSNMFALVFLILFSRYFSCAYRCPPCYKYSATAHLA